MMLRRERRERDMLLSAAANKIWIRAIRVCSPNRLLIIKFQY